MLFRLALTAGWLAALSATVPAAAQQGIYTCVDGKGRRITADRPIVECIDRTQKELSNSGLLKREVGPSMTAQERAAQEEKDKLAAEERARVAEDKRRDRALLLRYPNRAVHDQERAAALAQVDEVTKTANKRVGDLAEQRKTINAELEFYSRDPSKAPPMLKRRIEENDANMNAQKTFIAGQELNKKRVNQRFDEELVKLGTLWGMAGPASPATGAPRTVVKN